MPRKKNTIEKELKKKNKEAAENIVKMAEQENSNFEDVVSTVTSSASNNEATIAVRSRSARIENPTRRAKEATRSNSSKTTATEKEKPNSKRSTVKGKPDAKPTEKSKPDLKRPLKKIDVSSSKTSKHEETTATEKGKPNSKRYPVKDNPDPKRSTEKTEPDLKRPLEKIENVSSSKTSNNQCNDGAKIAKKSFAGKKISKAPKAFCYEIDCQKVEDSVDVKDLQQFVMTQLKLNGKKDNLKNTVTVSVVGPKVLINSKVFIPKRSLRFLTKKFLKNSWNVQVISQNKNSYELKYVGTE